MTSKAFSTIGAIAFSACHGYFSTSCAVQELKRPYWYHEGVRGTKAGIVGLASTFVAVGNYGLFRTAPTPAMRILHIGYVYSGSVLAAVCFKRALID